MKTTVKTIVVLFLIVNGLGAFYGGYQLISDPTGEKIQMPLSYLEHSPFDNYLIPGIILFLVNGVFSFVTLAFLFLKRTKYPWLIIAQGILLTGWIVVQLLMLRIFYAPMHITFLAIGVCLIGCGVYLKNTQLFSTP